MLGGYSDVAAGLYMEEDQQQPQEEQPLPLPAEYLPKFPGPDPWHRNSSCPEDFLMIAEFSEQEGPKPLLTIPDDLSSQMDLNEFSVKIMSVDFQTVSSEKFAVSDDTQVVISQSQHGVHAYIHHFTLYDSQARGFVRPFCMAYVTPDNSKIMSLYEKLQGEFSEVAQLFKYGNLEQFVSDMTHYSTDLQYTKQRFHEENDPEAISSTEGHPEPPGSLEDDTILQSVTLPALNKAIMEVKHILDTTTEMLNDKNLEVLKGRFEKLRLRQQGAVVSPDLDDNTLTFDRFSRSLSECHASSPPASKHRAGSCSDLTTAEKSRPSSYADLYVPKLVRTTNKRRFDKYLRTLDDLCPIGGEEGKKKLNTIYNYFCRDMATLLVERKDEKLMDPNCGLLSIGSNVEVNFLTDLQLDGLVGGMGMKTSESVFSGRWDDNCSFQSAESFLSCQDEFAFEDQHSFGSYENISCEDAMNMENISKEQTAHPDLSRSTVSGSSGVSSKGSSSGGKIRLFSSTDHLHCMGPGLPGYGIKKVVQDYAFSPHLIYAVLCGRLVAVVGTTKFETQIRFIVNALSMFIPGQTSGCVIPWRSSTVKMADLSVIKLLGLRCPDKKSLDQFIPTNIRKHITVFDVERRKLLTPGYQGGVVTDICNKHKCFSSNTAYVAYIHSVLIELSSKAFIYFHAFCMNQAQAQSGTQSSNPVFQRNQQSFFTKLKVGSDDSQIIQYLVDVIVNQQMKEFSVPAVENPELLGKNITLSNRKCGLFKL